MLAPYHSCTAKKLKHPWAAGRLAVPRPFRVRTTLCGMEELCTTNCGTPQEKYRVCAIKGRTGHTGYRTQTGSKGSYRAPQASRLLCPPCCAHHNWRSAPLFLGRGTQKKWGLGSDETVWGGLNWSGVDPPLSSSRACLTTFIAISVPWLSVSRRQCFAVRPVPRPWMG